MAINWHTWHTWHTLRQLRVWLYMGVAMLVWLCAAQNAAANTITVTTPTDEFDPGANALCSLREAVASANADAAMGGCVAGLGADIVILPPGTYILSRTGSEEDGNLTGDLDVSGTLEIVGQGQDQTVINANRIDRALQVLPDSLVSVTQVSILNGYVMPPAGFFGGGVYNDGGLQMTLVTLQGNFAVFGGAIFNSISGTLVMSNVLVTQNTSEYSGVISNNGHARISFFRVVGNNAADSGLGSVSNGGNGGVGTPGRDGGVMELETGVIAGNTGQQRSGLGNVGVLSATNMTISGNTSDLSYIGGQGLALFQSGVATFTNATIFGNLTLSSVELVLGSQTYFGNTIIAQLKSCEANLITSLGHNLTDCTSSPTGFSQPTDLIKSAGQFRLSALRDEGGVNLVHELLGGSPAIDAGDNALCLSRDQRGLKRPQHGVCDIGAVEFPGDYVVSLTTVQNNFQLPVICCQNQFNRKD